MGIYDNNFLNWQYEHGVNEALISDRIIPKQERFAVGCVLPACQPQVLWWPPDVSNGGQGGSSNEQV